METGEQEPIAMDAETQEELTVPSSGAMTDEPVIPTNLECQVENNGGDCYTGDGHPGDGGRRASGATFHRNQDCRDPKGELCNNRHESSGSVGKVEGDRTGSN